MAPGSRNLNTERRRFPGRSQRSERFSCGAPWAGAPQPGRTTLRSPPNGLSPWLTHTAFGPPLPCIVTALGNFTSMQTISPWVELKQGVFKPEDQKVNRKNLIYAEEHTVPAQPALYTLAAAGLDTGNAVSSH